MKSRHMRVQAHIAGAMAAALLAAWAATPAAAQPRFDGMWNVSLVTEKGNCDPGYSYPIQISNGVLRNAGPTPIDIVGRVVDSGAITVRVIYGDKSASVSGRLSGAVGTGRWNTSDCKGHWTAARG